jgi:tetratricopeptide (TPR) repeat protein
MLDFILPALIFLSLGTIVFFVAKYYPQLKEEKNEKRTEIDQKTETARKKISGLLINLINKIKYLFILVAEKTVKKAKEILHLLHYWIIRLKKKNGKKKTEEDEFLEEIEAKEELIRQEEEGLERVIHEDLGSSEQEEMIEKARQKIEKTGKEDVTIVKKTEMIQKGNRRKQEGKLNVWDEELADPTVNLDKEEVIVSEESLEEGNFSVSTKGNSHKKVADFFSGQELDKNGIIDEGDDIVGMKSSQDIKQEAQKEIAEEGYKEGGRIKKILGFPKRFVSNFFQKKEQTAAPEEINYNEEEFSDGIVKIEEDERMPVKESFLINEVVRMDKNKDIDEEIGVDRQILEKKLINKIVNNPKQVENYRQLGELYIKMENFSEAGECYQQILRIKMRDIDAKRKLEKIKLLKRIKKQN